MKYSSVQLVKTVVLKLYNYGDELDTLIYGYTAGMDYVSKLVHDHGRPMGSGKIQKLVYSDVRSLGLKSQMACNICRQVSGTYKTMWEQVKIGQTEWQLIQYSPTNVTFSYQRDFTITSKEISITTLNGRKKYPFHMYKNAEQYFDGSWEYLASKLIKHKDGYYFHLSVSKDVDNPPSIVESSTFMGVDVGMNWLAVANTTDNKCKFFYGGKVKHIRSTYKGMRKRLQAKGTKSSKRMLKRLEGKERRLMASINHIVSKQIVAFAHKNQVMCIGLEDLTGIRTDTQYNCRKKDRYHKSSWAFYQLQEMIGYKAKQSNIGIEFIDPRYTSQTCPRCYHVDKNNRRGKDFICKCCGFHLHSDLVGARNIELRTRNARYTLELQGCEVNHPDECPDFLQSLKPLPQNPSGFRKG